MWVKYTYSFYEREREQHMSAYAAQKGTDILTVSFPADPLPQSPSELGLWACTLQVGPETKTRPPTGPSLTQQNPTTCATMSGPSPKIFSIIRNFGDYYIT